MKYDLTTASIIQEIKEDYATKGIELSDQEIFNICDIQFKILHFGITKGVTVRLPIIGTFKRKRLTEIIEGMTKVFQLKEKLSANDYSKVILEAKLRQLESKKEYKRTMKRVQTLQELKDLHNFKIKKINFEKVLGNE